MIGEELIHTTVQFIRFWPLNWERKKNLRKYGFARTKGHILGKDVFTFSNRLKMIPTSNSLRSKYARMIKCMLICFLYNQGIIQKEFVPQTKRSTESFLKKGSLVWDQTLRTIGCCILSHGNINKQFFGQ